MFPIWGDNCILCFFAGAYAARRSTRLSFTLTRECQRLVTSGCFSAKCSFRPPAYKSGWNAAE